MSRLSLKPRFLMASFTCAFFTSAFFICALSVAFMAQPQTALASSTPAPCRDLHDALAEIRILHGNPSAQHFADNLDAPQYAQLKPLYDHSMKNMEIGNYAQACESLRRIKTGLGITGTGSLQLSPDTCTEQSLVDRYLQAVSSRPALAWQQNPDDPRSKQAASVFEDTYKKIESFVNANNLQAACAQMQQLENFVKSHDR